MNDIMTEIRKLKDEIAYLEADKKQLEVMDGEYEKDIHEVYTEMHKPMYGMLVFADSYAKLRQEFNELCDELEDLRVRIGSIEWDLINKKNELRKLRRAAYHVEGECQYCLLDLNGIAGVIDKDGFIRGIKF